MTKSTRWLLLSIALVYKVCALVEYNSQPDQPIKDPLKIAVIGGGIAGAASSYFLKHHPSFGGDGIVENGSALLGSKTADSTTIKEVFVDLFEQSKRLGGRIANVVVASREYEAGAAVYHGSNLYMKHFVSKMNLRTDLPRDPSSDGKQVLWDGTDIILEIGQKTGLAHWINRFFRSPSTVPAYRYGLLTLKSLSASVNDTFTKWKSIYGILPKVFETVEEFCNWISVSHMVSQSAMKYFKRSSVWFNSRLVTELVSAVNRGNYGQSENMNSFASSISLIGAGRNVYGVSGGNQQIVEALIDRSADRIMLNTTVTRITRQGARRFALHFEENGQLQQATYDAIIVATPLELAVGLDLTEVISGDKHSSLYWPYHKTEISWVTANALSHHYFGMEDVVSVGTPEYADAELPFVSIHVEDYLHDQKLYKVNSRRRLEEEDVKKIFVNGQIQKQISWTSAYSELPPKDVATLPPFRLTEGLYYPCAIESVSSAMEVSAVGARMAVELLVTDFL